jgi:RNA polymerase sigma factor (sigma-70 family)
MREQPLHAAVRHLRAAVAGPPDAETSDRELLRRFTRGRDEDAFAVLVRRHGPMVREVARRWLGQEPDVEDAFQAVFLVLSCKANSIRKRRSLAGWLHGVTYRTAQRARRDAARRKRHEGGVDVRGTSDPAAEAARRELGEALDTELARLPEGLRSALVLCYLEGHTRDEAARQLGQSIRTLDRRLQKGRERLRRRLVRRGITLSGALLALGLTQDLTGAAVPARLAAITGKSAADILAGRPVALDGASPEAISLMKGVLKSMLRTRIKLVVTSLLALGLLGTAAGLLAFRAAAKETSAAPPPADDPAAVKPAPEPDVYALLLIEEGEPRLLFHGRRAAGDGDPSTYRRTQAVLLKSRSTLQAALQRKETKGLAIIQSKADPVRWLGQNVEAVFLENTGVLRVSLREGRPEERATLINAVVEQYLNEVVYSEQREKEQRVAEVDKLLSVRDDSLKQKRDALSRLSRQLGIASSAIKRHFDRDDLSLYRKELLRVRLAKVAAQARHKHRKAGAGEGGKAAVAELEEEIAVLAEQEKLLQQNISEVTEKVLRASESEAAESGQLQSLRDAIAAEELFYKELVGRLETYRTELRAGPRVRLLQSAEAGRKGK